MKWPFSSSATPLIEGILRAGNVHVDSHMLNVFSWLPIILGIAALLLRYLLDLAPVYAGALLSYPGTKRLSTPWNGGGGASCPPSRLFHKAGPSGGSS